MPHTIVLSMQSPKLYRDMGLCWVSFEVTLACAWHGAQIQEEFAFGISAELTRLRTAEKVILELILEHSPTHMALPCYTRRPCLWLGEPVPLFHPLRVQYDILGAVMSQVTERTQRAAAAASQQVTALPCLEFSCP